MVTKSTWGKEDLKVLLSWVNFKILVSVLGLSLLSCKGPQKGYQEVDGKWVYVTDHGRGSDKIFTPLSVDRASFEVFGQKGYAKDKTRVFSQGIVIEGAHVPSFEPLPKSENGIYARDKQRVYLMGFPLRDADPKTFKIIKGIYGKDRSYVFCGTLIIEGADPAKTEILEIVGLPGVMSDQESIADIFGQEYAGGGSVVSDGGWCRDGKNYYYMNKRLEGADYDSFVIIDAFTAKDKNGRFNGNRRVPKN